MQFKQDILRQQFYDLFATDPRLRAVVTELDFFFQQKFERELVITSVCRTEEEQSRLYPEFFARMSRCFAPARI